MTCLRSLSFLFLPALVFACSPSSGGSSSVGGSDTPCGRYYNALTAFAARCGQGTGLENQSSAPARFETTCNNLLNAPGTSNGAAQIDACATKFNSLACNQDADCTITGGTLAVGTACEETYQCNGFCDKGSSSTGDSDCGKCAPTVALGAACMQNDECGPGNVCQFVSGASGTCIVEPAQPAPVAIGGACESSSDCDSSQAFCKDKKCTALPTEGQACDFDCAPGLACAADNKCAKFTTVAVGASCDQSQRCQDSICLGLTYNSTQDDMGNITMTVTPGKCTVPLADGAPCNKDDQTQHCDSFAECVNGTCQMENPNACK